MKRIMRVAVLLASVGVSAGWLSFSAVAQDVAETQFMSAVEDLPLPSGLVEVGDPVVFDSDFGRVIHSRADGKIADRDVQDFYAQTLPALGWKALGEADHGGWSYERGYERLTITPQMVNHGGGKGVETAFELVISAAPTRLE